jgi:hypothetical protein
MALLVSNDNDLMIEGLASASGTESPSSFKFPSTTHIIIRANTMNAFLFVTIYYITSE